MGLILASIYLLFLAIPTVFFGYDAFEAEGGSVGRTIRLYMVAGAAGGCLVGALLPFTRTRLGAALVGMIAIAPYFILQSGVLFDVADGETVLSWLEVAGMSAGVGGLAGYLVRDKVFPELDSIDRR